MPAFSILAPLVGSALKAGSDNTNRRKQFEQGNIRNTFSVFTGGPRQNLSPLLANNSINTVLQGVAGAQNSAQALNNQAAQAQVQQALLQRLVGGNQGQALTLNAPQQVQSPGQNFSSFFPQVALA